MGLCEVAGRTGVRRTLEHRKHAPRPRPRKRLQHLCQSYIISLLSVMGPRPSRLSSKLPLVLRPVRLAQQEGPAPSRRYCAYLAVQWVTYLRKDTRGLGATTSCRPPAPAVQVRRFAVHPKAGQCRWSGQGSGLVADSSRQSVAAPFVHASVAAPVDLRSKRLIPAGRLSASESVALSPRHTRRPSGRSIEGSSLSSATVLLSCHSAGFECLRHRSHHSGEMPCQHNGATL